MASLEKRESEATCSTSTVAIEDEEAKSVDELFDLQDFQFLMCHIQCFR